MSAKREERSRRRQSQAFRPSLDSSLESRNLLSTVPLLKNPVVQVANHGNVAIVYDTDGEKYDVIVTGGGSVKASPMPGGKVKIVLYGTLPTSTMEIDPVNPIRQKGNAHKLPVNAKAHDGVLHVGSISVATGDINQILAYRTANLSGPLTVAGTTTVDRIALNALEPGASIRVGTPPPAPGMSGLGDVNTLDVFTSVNLTSGPGIVIGRDLNYMQVNGSITLTNGASLLTGRAIGLIPQPAKGTDLGGVGIFDFGDLTIGPGSLIAPAASLVNNITVLGFATPETVSRVIIPPGSTGHVNVLGGQP